MKRKFNPFASKTWISRKLSLRLMLVFSVAIPLTLLSSLASAQATDAAELSSKLRLELDNVVFPAMQSGDVDTFYDSFGPIILKRDPETVKLIESYAADAGLESPLDFLVEVKLMRVEQGIDSSHELLAMKPTMTMIEGINRKVEEFYQTVASHAFMRDPIVLPDEWTEARDLFWSSHVLKNEFANYEKVLQYGTHLLAKVKPRLKKAEPQDLDSAETLVQYGERFSQLRNDLHEAEAVARLMRFQRSANQLQQSSDFRQRLIAAMSIELDSEFLIPFLSSRSHFSRAELNGAMAILGDVQNKVAEFRRDDQELLQQASLFRSGSHWWLRGRYGRGALANGLLKTKKAVRNDAAMNALYMPRQRPVAEDNFIGAPSSESTQPFYKRRHYYTWALEYRPLTTDRNQRRDETVLSRNTSREVLSSTISKKDFFY